MRLAAIALALLFAAARAQSPLGPGAPPAQSPSVPQNAPAGPPSAPSAMQSAPGGQVAAPAPSFEVATIKPSDPDQCCARTFGRNGRRFQTTNTNLQYLMQYAFGLQYRQIAIGQPWINEDRYNIAGEIEGVGTPNDQQWREALQKLLIDRFQIQMHREVRQLPAYALVIADAKKGPKLTPSAGDADHPQRMGFSGGIGQTMSGGGNDATLKELCDDLQRLTLDRPVVDRTGLTGTFDIRLTFTRDDPQAPSMAALPDGAAPTIFNALQEQLGLKLEPTKAPIEVLVIDHAEKPSVD
jgi:uncharacterized protein (TIGR03435 family)